MAVFNQPTGISLNQDYWAMALNDRHVLQQIIKVRPQYSSMYRMMNMLSSPLLVDKRVVEQPYTDIAVPTVQCASAVLSANNTIATVTLQGVSDDILASPFQLVDSSTKVVGTIITHSASTVVLKFVSAPDETVKAFTSSDFTGGTVATQSTSASIDYDASRSTESQYYLPQLRQLPIGTETRSVTLKKSDMIEKNRIVKTTANGIQYLAWMQVDRMLSEFMNGLEIKMHINNKVMPDKFGNGGQFAGLQSQIINEGGSYQTMNTAPNEAEIIKSIEYIRDQRGHGGEILIAAGTGAYGAIQQSLGNKFIPYAGSNNTLGGKDVVGINIETYKYLDCQIKFLTDFNDFNHPQYFPAVSSIVPNQLKQKYAYYAFDANPVQIEGGQTVPFLTDYYYGLNSDKSDGSYQKQEAGNIDSQGAFSSVVTGDTPVVKYMMHKTTCPTLNRPQNHVYAELSA